MPREYYESRTPRTRLTAGSGVVIRWQTYDGEIGWFTTDDPAAVQVLNKCIERGVGGIIRKGTQAEYEAFVGKTKGRSVFRPDRETISPGSVATETISPPVKPPQPPASGAVVAADDGVPPVQPVVSAPEPVLRPRGRRTGDKAA